jgi:uncharacterized protein (TIGR00730 family)
VFAGSAGKTAKEYTVAAEQVGTWLGKNRYGLVYGGASVGLMGTLANAALKAGAEVIGVIPTWLGSYEIAHRGLDRQIWVGSMAERKDRMFQLSDAFLTLPGGIGTLDELFEVMTMVALGQFEKPHGILNISGYYQGLLSFLDRAVDDGLVRHEVRARLRVAETPEMLLSHLFPELSP